MASANVIQPQSDTVAVNYCDVLHFVAVSRPSSLVDARVQWVFTHA